VGDTVSYVKSNSDRTSWVINEATGQLSIMEQRMDSECGPGYVLKMAYELDVKLKGKQKGDMGIFVPEALFASLFKEGKTAYGAFDITHKGYAKATSAKGVTYEQCSVNHATNVDHLFKPGAGSTGKAKVLWVNHQGSIKSVKDLEINFKAHKDVPVLGAVEINVSGISNNGVSFKIGMDANF
jgi:hypothetical protein